MTEKSEMGRVQSDDGVTPAAERQVWLCSYCEAWQIDVPLDVPTAEVERLLAEHVAECLTTPASTSGTKEDR